MLNQTLLTENSIKYTGKGNSFVLIQCKQKEAKFEALLSTSNRSKNPNLSMG